MKKIQLIISFFISIGIFSQNQQLNYDEFPKPVPSVSYNATYQEMPVSTATGIPNISIPVGGISSQGDKISENLTLSYNPYNVNDNDFVSEVGLGWTLFSGGTISRQIVGGLDEFFDNASASNYNLNTFDDIYYYNLPNGVSGKFKIYRDISDNTFTITNYDRNSIKMEFTRTSNTATLIINSFTLTDDKGYKYLFSDFSQSMSTAENKLFRSAFFITSIKNPNGIELLTYEYQKNNQYISGTSTLLYQNCKLKKINSIGLGTIDIEYEYDSSLNNSFNDSYSISKIKAQNQFGNNLFEYNFEYSFKQFSKFNNSKRVLEKISKKNYENPNSPEITKFEYYTTSLTDENKLTSITPFCSYTLNPQIIFPEKINIALLKRIIHPTGGVTEYNFEPNEFFLDKNTNNYIATLENYVDPYIQSITHQNSFTYNSSQNSSINWVLSGDPSKKKKIYIHFYAEPWRVLIPVGGGGGLETDPGDGTTPILQPNLEAKFKIDNGAIEFNSCGITESPFDYSQDISIEIYPGNHTIEIITPNRKGNIFIYELINNDPPYRNVAYQESARIKNIKTYQSLSDADPIKTVSYSYDLFDEPLSPSGAKFANENPYFYSEYILYKNVRISEGENMGYINNYFKLPSEYPDTYVDIGGVTHTVKNYYNLTQSGLLSKKSIFNNSNNKIKEFIYDYELQQSNGIVEIATGYGYMRLGVIKKLKVQETDFLANQIITNKRESNYENKFRFNNISSTKEINSDGTVTEKIYNYPSLLTIVGQTNEYQHLIDNNIKGIPIQIIEKKNGAVVSTVDTKYANSSLYPTSVISENAFDGSLKTAIRYDKYDNKGNLLQYTTNIDENTGEGFPTTLVYGYNQTLPIVKIEGAKVSDLKFILTPIGSPGIVALSDQDVDDASEKSLMEGLDEYRNNFKLKDFMVTTFTYDPLIGITSVTPPNGVREIYKYDSNGKLNMVVDVNGNILNEYKYNVKPQP